MKTAKPCYACETGTVRQTNVRGRAFDYRDEVDLVVDEHVELAGVRHLRGDASRRDRDEEAELRPRAASGRTETGGSDAVHRDDRTRVSNGAAGGVGASARSVDRVPLAPRVRHSFGRHAAGDLARGVRQQPGRRHRAAGGNGAHAEAVVGSSGGHQGSSPQIAAGVAQAERSTRRCRRRRVANSHRRRAIYATWTLSSSARRNDATSIAGKR